MFPSKVFPEWRERIQYYSLKVGWQQENGKWLLLREAGIS
jgi:hypothetical protein